jgi:glycosyltransferase involved in cell wall biosynthesis
MENAYERCDFTVYPSLMEGFGLPVMESLIRKRPCLCSSKGALGEVSKGGGCLSVEEPSPAELTQALRRLLTEPSLLKKLSNEAAQRQFRSWKHYADTLQTWARGL